MRIAFLSLVFATQLLPGQPRPRFDVVSVKPCIDESAGNGERKGGRAPNSPGTLSVNCNTVMGLIRHAYVLFANGHVNPDPTLTIEGGPGWIQSEQYQIEAKSDVPRAQGLMHGPMLQGVLEERFGLKIRRESRQMPAWALTVVKGGPKMRPFQTGTCVPLDFSIFEQFPPPEIPKLPAGQQYCGGVDPADGRKWIGSVTMEKGPNLVLEARGMTIDEFVKQGLGRKLDRPVVNQTGLAGRFDYRLEFAPEEPGRAAAEPAREPIGPPIATALEQQLGLKLVPAKAPRAFLIIDQVSRPAAN
jgi:uncharacterized protein (TIGR03435 family)